ncbi:MAG: YgjV family protein [Erysipelotrichaceae bacterium]|nr:YgjV family protein [Erysipelotrichaceae bacterium]
MNINMLIEAFGYLGSLLVLVSMLMTSVVKLRIINTIGSVIFTIYAFIIKSYPTALMNFCLVLINLRFLWKMSRMDKEYEIVECDRNDVLLRYLVDHYRNDISKIFPGIDLNLRQIDRAYVVLCQGKPVGITLGNAEDDDTLDLKLDYTIPEFRDFSIGSFLFDYLKKKDVRKVVYKGPDENHLAYLNNQGFVKKGNSYIKNL